MSGVTSSQGKLFRRHEVLKDRTEEGYTIEDLERESQFSRSLIYDLSSYGCINRPVRGIEPSLYGSKGLYPLNTLNQINRYKELKRAGLKKDSIIRVMKAELQCNQEASECSDIQKAKEKKLGD